MHTIKIFMCGQNNMEICLFVTYCGSVRNREVKEFIQSQTVGDKAYVGNLDSGQRKMCLLTEKGGHGNQYLSDADD